MTMSSTAQLRKIKKPMIERRRRERINDCLQQLKGIILDFESKEPSRYSKMEKADILEMTVKHLKEMHLILNCSRLPCQTPRQPNYRATTENHPQHSNSTVSEAGSSVSSSPSSSPDIFQSQSPIRLLSGAVQTTTAGEGITDQTRSYKEGFTECSQEVRQFSAITCGQDLRTENREALLRHLDRCMDGSNPHGLSDTLKQSNLAGISINNHFLSAANDLSSNEVLNSNIGNSKLCMSPSEIKQIKLESREADVVCQRDKILQGEEEISLSHSRTLDNKMRDSPKSSVFINSGLPYSATSPPAKGYISMTSQEYPRLTTFCLPSSLVPSQRLVGYGSMPPSISASQSIQYSRYAAPNQFYPTCTGSFEVDINNNVILRKANTTMDSDYMFEARSPSKFESKTSHNVKDCNGDKSLCQSPRQGDIFPDQTRCSVVQSLFQEHYVNRGSNILVSTAPSWRPWERS